MEGNYEEGQKKEGENVTEERESRPSLGSGDGEDDGEKNEEEDGSAERKESDVPKNVYNKTNSQSSEGNETPVEPISQSITREASVSDMNKKKLSSSACSGNTISADVCLEELSVGQRRDEHLTAGQGLQHTREEVNAEREIRLNAGSLATPGAGSHIIDEEKSGHQHKRESANNPGVGSEETDRKGSETSPTAGSSADSIKKPQLSDLLEDGQTRKTEPTESIHQTGTEERRTKREGESSTSPIVSGQQKGTEGRETQRESGTSGNPIVSGQQTGTEGRGIQRQGETSTNPIMSGQQTGTEGRGIQRQGETSKNPVVSGQQTGQEGRGTHPQAETSTNPIVSCQQTGIEGRGIQRQGETSTNPIMSGQETGTEGRGIQRQGETSTNHVVSGQQTGPEGRGTHRQGETSTNPIVSCQQTGIEGRGIQRQGETSTNPIMSVQQTGPEGRGTQRQVETSTNPIVSAKQLGTEGRGMQREGETSTNSIVSGQQTGTEGSGIQRQVETSTNSIVNGQQTGTEGMRTQREGETSSNPIMSAKQLGTEGRGMQREGETSTNSILSGQQTGTDGRGTQRQVETPTNPILSGQQTRTEGREIQREGETSTNPIVSGQQTGTEGRGTQRQVETSTNPVVSGQQTGTEGRGTQRQVETSTNSILCGQQTGPEGRGTQRQVETSTNSILSGQQTGPEGRGTQREGETNTNPIVSGQQTGTEGRGTQRQDKTSSNPIVSGQQTGTEGRGIRCEAEISHNPVESVQQRGAEGNGSQKKPETSTNHVLKDLKMDQSTQKPISGSTDARDGHLAAKKCVEKSEEEMRKEENRANEEKIKTEGAAANEGSAASRGFQQSEDPTKKDTERPVSISLCTSAYEFNVRGLLTFLEDMKDVMLKDGHSLIKNVKIHELPYNNLDDYEFSANNPVDVMILCHSINNRRFAITDVMDALYDKYLPYCQRVIGKEKMGVIVHDFDDMRESVQSSRMGSFEYKQPTAFKTTSLQIICGYIETKEQVKKQMQQADQDKLINFIKDASKWPEGMKTEQLDDSRFNARGKISSKFSWSSFKRSFSSVIGSKENTWEGSSVDSQKDEEWTDLSEDQNEKTKRRADDNHSQSYDAKRSCGPPRVSKTGNSSGSHQPAQTRPDKRKIASTKGQMQDTSNALAKTHAQGLQPKAQQSGGAAPRRISISVCSSAYEHNVQGFITKLNELKTSRPHMISDVRFRSLPYNDIDSFRFPPEDSVDVMVLCHSVDNRGFSITDVVNALYEKYLQYCHDVIGKRKVAVVVHDFSDCQPMILETRMNAFKRSQPLTFELADTVMVCGRLEDKGNVEIKDEDWTNLTTFLEKARFEPKENKAKKEGLVKNFFGSFGSLW